VRDPAQAFDMTSRANLIAWSPTAPRCSAWRYRALAAKPVMEQERAVQELPARLLASSSTSAIRQAGRHHRRPRADFRRHQLEDIKAPECFTIERSCAAA